MNHYQFESKLQVSADGKRLLISNRKPIANPPYVYEKEPEDLELEKKALNQAAGRGKLDEEMKALEQREQLDLYQWTLSSASCDIANIEGIVYGGRSSRFWLFRKHMISMGYDAMRFAEQGGKCAFPFYAWECLSLQVAGRSVDLVIKSYDDLKLVINFLIQAINTVDGCANSAQFYIEAATLAEIKRREK